MLDSATAKAPKNTPKAASSETNHEGYVRRRRGNGFDYYDGSQPVEDEALIARFQALSIPPAWREVRIARNPHDKLQASGLDAAGRRQAIYHPEFRAEQDKAKFERILRFAAALPKLRRQIDIDLSRRKLRKDKVLACVVKLMDEAYFRVGNELYARQHHHYGITTLRRKHADIRTTSVTFDFIGKSGQAQHKQINDRQLAHIIKQLEELPGYEIFKYIDDSGHIRDVDSHDVNQYIKQHMGDEYTAKDFRTWGGTLLATIELTATERADNELARKRAITACVRNVAKRLGNTPAVTRSSYIDPRILKAYATSDQIAKVRESVQKMRPRKYLKQDERCVLSLLQNAG